MKLLSKILLLLTFVIMPISAMAVLDIKNCTDLQNMALNLSGQYQLVADMDCSDKDFRPIGDFQNPFRGSLNGNGHRIKNLYM